MKKHICAIRSLCEGLGKGNEEKIFCLCGKHYKDPIHYTSKQLDKLTKEERKEAYL